VAQKLYVVFVAFVKCLRNFARRNNNNAFFPCKLANSQNQSPIRAAVVHVSSDSGFRNKIKEKT
jgi:hypothetical protein